MRPPCSESPTQHPPSAMAADSVLLSVSRHLSLCRCADLVAAVDEASSRYRERPSELSSGECRRRIGPGSACFAQPFLIRLRCCYIAAFPDRPRWRRNMVRARRGYDPSVAVGMHDVRCYFLTPAYAVVQGISLRLTKTPASTEVDVPDEHTSYSIQCYALTLLVNLDNHLHIRTQHISVDAKPLQT